MSTRFKVTCAPRHFVSAVISLAMSTVVAQPPTALTQPEISRALSFTTNAGQWPDSVLFGAKTSGTNIWFTSNAVYHLYSRIEGVAPALENGKPDPSLCDHMRSILIKKSFVGGSESVRILPDQEQSYTCNYFLGNDSTKWRTDVSNHGELRYCGVYPGIDLRFYGDRKKLEYDFVISPGADYRSIELAYEGVSEICVEESGDLLLETSFGSVPEKIPSIYQEIAGEKKALRGRFVKNGDFRVKFELDEPYDQAIALVIDPTVEFSTYLGGSDIDQAFAVTTFGASAYICGSTTSSDFPMVAAFDSTFGGVQTDAYVSKFSADGSSLTYSTYLGGPNPDYAYAIATDTTGRVYLTGVTASNAFPTASAFDASYNGGNDAFVTKMNPAGNALVFSTFLGGTLGDYGLGIASDSTGAAYVVGYTQGSGFQTKPGSFDESYNGGPTDGFVTKINAGGTTLAYSTFLGSSGAGQDRAIAIAVDKSLFAYVGGQAASSDFPTTGGAYDNTHNGGGTDAFVTIVNIGGDNLFQSTFLGGASTDNIAGIFLDSTNNIYVTGTTASTNFPVTGGPFSATNSGGNDIFAARLSSNAGSLLYSTYIGGTADEDGNGIAVTKSGAIWVTGNTNSSNYPLASEFDATFAGSSEAVVTRIVPGAPALTLSSFYGGNGGEFGYGISVAPPSSVYIVGYTLSTDFPTVNAYDVTPGGGEAYLVKIDGNPQTPPYTVTATDTAEVFYVRQADLDKDNNTDVVYCGRSTGQLVIAYGKPDGTFETPIEYPQIQQAALTVGFISADTLLDIVARKAGKLYVMRNLGGRIFAIDSLTALADLSSERSPTSTTFVSLASGYFNADTYPDLVASENRILFGDGSGTFTTSSTLPFTFDAVDAADIDHDGDDDIVVSSADSAKIYLNNGSGVFTRTAAIKIAFFTYDVTSVITSVDFNRDGEIDFAALSGRVQGGSPTSVLTVVLGDGAGGILSSTRTDISGRVVNMAVSDVDKDGLLDITVVNDNVNALQVYYGDGGGGFQTSSTISLAANTNSALALTNADVNRDGNPDFVVGGSTGSPVMLAVNQLPGGPILIDQMVVTGYDNVELKIANPDGLVISQSVRTVAGSAYWRFDVDQDGKLDDQAYDYNLQYGTYQITISRRTILTDNVSSIIGIDGSQNYRIFHNYGNLGPMGTDSIVFTFDVEPVSSVKPASGAPTSSVTPSVSWEGYAQRAFDASTYQFQLSRFHNFTTLMLDSSGLTSPSIRIATPLGTDSVYYWRFKHTGDIDFSHAFALNVASDACCKGSTGNVDCDSGDGVDISDLAALIDYLYISFSPLCCTYEANTDGSPDGGIDIADLSALIDYLYISFTNPAFCP